MAAFADSDCQGQMLDVTIVAVIPAYNEERLIASVVITARQYADHVVVIDDGSSDRTALVAGLAGAQVVCMSRNMGKGQALNAGFDLARGFDPDVIVMLDGDAQHDPAEIPILARPIVEGKADVVIGSRFLSRRSVIPRWRRFGQHALTLVTNTASGVSTTDSQRGYRAFSPDACRLLRFQTGGLAMESEMQFLLHGASLRMAEVPISVQYLDARKRNPLLHGLQVVEAIVGLVTRRKPLMFMSVPGLLAMMLGCMLGLWVVDAVEHRHVLPIGTAVLSTLLVIVGLLLSLTGIILNSMERLLRRVHEEVSSTVKQFSAVPRHTDG